jgi:ABC-type Na+ efflux pump permease subunit
MLLAVGRLLRRFGPPTTSRRRSDVPTRQFFKPPAANTMYRTLVILRHTFVAAVAQPVFLLVTLLGIALIGIYAMLPFFTLGDDTRMYKSVCLDVVLLLTLVATLLGTSRCIYDEIEDRTMLTLMSKPVSRLQVLLGKYLGLIAAAGLMVLLMGAALAFCVAERIPSDYLLNRGSLYDEIRRQISDRQSFHLAGLYPGLVLVWLQVSVLAAISVAISTRFALVVNLPVVILIYLAGNLTKFLGTAVDDRGPIARAFGWVVQTVFPYLAAFDLRDLTVFSDVKIAGTMFENAPKSVTASEIWSMTAMSGAYAVCFIVAAMCVGLLMFRDRELGGSEG